MRITVSIALLAAIGAVQAFDFRTLLTTPEDLAAYDNVVSRKNASQNKKIAGRCCDFLSPCCDLDTCCESRDTCYVDYCGLSNPAGGACALGCLTACPASEEC
ncbi:hypothetical protein O988_02282 [Pseudogymnoascus sp. VKM F-3808]|nr:hypothetical protein O988_02282 [Pseudogymnoascus sp. VKM F-3808]